MKLFVLALCIMLFYALYKSKKAMHMLQQNYYDESNRYLFWIFKNVKKVFVSMDIIFLSLLVFLFIKMDIYVLSGFICGLYVVIMARYISVTKKEQTKKPLVITARIKRLFITETILYLIPIIIMLCNYNDDLASIYFLVIGAMAYLSYFVILIANKINIPVEKCVYLHYKRMAMKKLKMMNIPVIGITGSYGKTSSKNILNDILSVKYNSFPTPKNFNTPYGLIRSINNYLDKFNDLFIAEMGAFKVGEIKTTCKLMKPTHGILTTIGEAHLESFGSRENIQKGKFELIESLPEGGIAVLNSDDEWQVSYKLKNQKCRVLWTGIKNQDADCVGLNIKLSGTGMTISELQRGVNQVKTIEHRLELKKSGRINIIDDAYNSNPVGSKMALDVLNLMPGLKIVVTPGMIELGDKQYELNKKFGEYISEAADYVILVGKEQTKPILDGLKEKGYNENKISVINDVREAFTIMNNLDQGNTYVLLENDLPDLFNE